MMKLVLLLLTRFSLTLFQEVENETEPKVYDTSDNYIEVINSPPNFFRGCWDPYATGVKRQVGDTWLHEKPGVGKCCQAVCKRWGSVEFSCTNKLCNELSTDFKFEQSKDKIYARVPYFDGCWDPHMKDMKRAVGDAWFRKGRGNTCCFGVCRKQGQVVTGCTAQACGFVPDTCPDENCSYSRRDPGKLLDIMIENESNETRITPADKECLSNQYCEIAKDPEDHGDDCVDPDGKKRLLDEFWYNGKRGDACCFGVCRNKSQLFACVKEACLILPKDCKPGKCAFVPDRDL